MPRKSQRYKSLSLPEQLLLQIEEFNKNNPEFGYGSKSDFICDAIREKLKRHKHGKFAPDK